MDPHRTPGTSVKEDGASMAMAEQQRPLLEVLKVFLWVVLEVERLWILQERNVCMCGVERAMMEDSDSEGKEKKESVFVLSFG